MRQLGPWLSGDPARGAASAPGRAPGHLSVGRLAAVALFVLVAHSTQPLARWSAWRDLPAAAVLADWLAHLGGHLLVGGAMLGAAVIASRAGIARAAGSALAIGCALVAGAVLGLAAVHGLAPRLPDGRFLETLPGGVAHWLFVAVLVGAICHWHGRGAEAKRRLQQAELARVRSEKSTLEARAQVLRAQFEPHFLFNTLATIRRLFRTEPARGRGLLEGFLHYLQATLPRMRQGETTLGQEVDLASAYLHILEARMGERLAVRIDVPHDLRATPFPPLMLSTLVENAIKHGIAPKPEGGEVSISAAADGEALAVVVSDTGVGIRASSGTGLGLANAHARLDALYGTRAHLALDANEPTGIRAVIRIPRHRSADH